MFGDEESLAICEHFKRLRRLSFRCCDLTKIPPCVKTLTCLEAIDLCGNELVGSQLPSALTLARLTELRVSHLDDDFLFVPLHAIRPLSGLVLLEIAEKLNERTVGIVRRLAPALRELRLCQGAINGLDSVHALVVLAQALPKVHIDIYQT